MKLYKISQNQDSDYDTYDSAVVAAPNEEIARNINPSDGEPLDWKEIAIISEKHTSWSCWCTSPDQVIIEYIGEAAIGIKQGVICASFNAG